MHTNTSPDVLPASPLLSFSGAFRRAGLPAVFLFAGMLLPSFAYASTWADAYIDIFPNATVSCNTHSYIGTYNSGTGGTAHGPYDGATVHSSSMSITAYGYTTFYDYWFNQVGGAPSVGDYYILVQCSGYPDRYVNFYYNGSGTSGTVYPPIITEIKTQVIVNSPKTTTATTTSPVTINFDAYLCNTIGEDGCNDGGGYVGTYGGYEITFANQQGTKYEVRRGWFSDTGFGVGDFNTVFNVSTSTSIGDGTWFYNIKLFDGLDSTTQDPIDDLLQASHTGYLPRTAQDFGVFSINTIDATALPSISYTFDTYASTTCAINFLGGFSLSDCMGYLFTPNESIRDKQVALQSQVQGTFPFSYAYQIGTVRDRLFNSTTTASTSISVPTPIGEITFLSKELMEAVPFASTIKSLLSAVMWFMVAFLIYRRVIKIHDNTSQV